ncbi:MAG: lysophospholipid acyltransferase family protein [Bryocella sp.]
MPANEILETEPVPPHPAISFALRWTNNLFVLPAAACATAGFGTISLIVGLWDKSGRQQHFIARLWARTLLRIALSPVTVEGLENLQALRDSHPAISPGKRVRRPLAVYAANHLSYYDTPMIFARLPFQFRILAKAPLWKIPFIGWYLKRSGQVPIDQTSARTGVASLGLGVKTIAHGLPLVIFPEGGRAATGELQVMAAGAAWIAIKAQVPLVPITLIGTYELLPIHVYALRPRPLKLIIGEPISTIGMTTKDAEALNATVHQVIFDTYTAENAFRDATR